MVLRRRLACAAYSFVLAICAGCAEETAQSVAVKRFDEVLTDAEWKQFEHVVRELGENGLADLVTVFPPLPDWQPTRTLAVKDLLAVEQRELDEHWDLGHIQPRFTQRPGLSRLLRREKLTTEQFVAIALAVAAASARAHLPDGDPPEEMLRRGRAVINALGRDQRLFSSLDPEERYHVLDQAIWLHRIDRVERLRKVPAENVARAKQHAEWLAKVLPPRFHAHPLADVADLLGEQGLPFVELPESGSDAAIEWDPATALGRR